MPTFILADSFLSKNLASGNKLFENKTVEETETRTGPCQQESDTYMVTKWACNRQANLSCSSPDGYGAAGRACMIAAVKWHIGNVVTDLQCEHRWLSICFILVLKD